MLMAGTALTAFILFSSVYFLNSIEKSVQTTEGRVGADLIVTHSKEDVNEPYGRHVLPGDELLPFVEGLEGVEVVAPELYLSTVSTICCGTEGDFPIVAFDPSRDFTLSSFMVKSDPLEDGEVVIGTKAGGDRFLFHVEDEVIQEKVKLFYKLFAVKNVLFPTGTKVDETIYMTLGSAHEMIKNKVLDVHIQEDAISAIFVKAEADRVTEIGRAITRRFPETNVHYGSGVKKEVASYVRPLRNVVYALIGLVVVTNMLQSITLYSAMLTERKKEIGMYRVMGIPTGKSVQLILYEVIVVTGAGSVIGICASLGLLYDHQTLLYAWSELPLVLPKKTDLFFQGGITMAVTMLISLFGSGLCLRSLYKQKPYRMVREGES